MTAKLSIPSSQQAATIAGDWVMEHCRHAWLQDSPAFRVMTCVVEAVNNCVEHAYRDTPGEIGIRLFRNCRWLVVQVQDRGQPVQGHRPAAETDPLQIDGRGWFIMRQWMDIAQYRRRKLKNVVTMAKYLDGSPDREL
jgi:anti-sigma regulatory factor (Ser/Thr protein kinase)